jgi:hypothetical protein
VTLYFTEAVEEMLAGRQVQMATGVWFDFATQEMRLWQGRGTFTAADGNVWQGLGEFGQVDGLQGSSMLSIDPVTMTLSGVDTSLVSVVRQQESEITGRRCGVYFLMFDQDFKPLDAPYLAELYLMDKATFSVDGESRTMTISLTAEPLFFSKHIPPVAMMSDADQQRKYPGDTIFQRVPLLNGKQTVYWVW